MNYVLDASALVAYLRGEQGGGVVQNLLGDPNSTCYAHSINLCEVYYQSVRQSGAAQAQTIIESLYTDGVVERRIMSSKFWRQVGDLKAIGRISLPDCMCISLSRHLTAEVVTSDHGEFD